MRNNAASSSPVGRSSENQTTMKANRSLPMLAVVALGLLTVLLPTTESCSCYQQHPQTAFCDSQYVIIAQVLRRTASNDRALDAYKIAIKKEYKMSDEARQQLRHGKLYTHAMGSMCGIKLEPNKLYAIASNSAQVGLCDFVRPYSELSIVEKRGLAGIYRKGCKCKIDVCTRPKCTQKVGSCSWSPYSTCETSNSSCVPTGIVNEDGTPIKCHWRRSLRYMQCLAKNGGK
ncbi:tissue inhibitor of metalloproteinase isoform X2 [Anopheles stephensi]|uniref:tissue inhibitor of metalloproteinase isoform X2 n=1 Tax=Anopheles stephensi TaxID=30069 RepID=UPI001658C031|nr:tissue inhibitor of metalloproteinase isoform X2 [Anopheles stephensi]